MKDQCIAVMIIEVEGEWVCACARCTFGLDVDKRWEPAPTTFNNCLRIAFQHLKECPKPIQWRPTRGMAHEEWLVRFL